MATKIFQIARELNLPSKAILEIARKIGIPAKIPIFVLNPEQ